MLALLPEARQQRYASSYPREQQLNEGSGQVLARHSFTLSRLISIAALWKRHHYFTDRETVRSLLFQPAQPVATVGAQCSKGFPMYFHDSIWLPSVAGGKRNKKTTGTWPISQHAPRPWQALCGRAEGRPDNRHFTVTRMATVRNTDNNESLLRMERNWSIYIWPVDVENNAVVKIGQYLAAAQKV